MLVREQNIADTPAEQELIDWLRTWKGQHDPPGVAAQNCSLPHAGRQVRFDVVLWMPTSCVVIQIETLTEQVHGELEIPLNGPWRVDGQVVTPVGTDRRDSPLDRIRDDTFALQSWLAERGLGQRVVYGVVLVVPPHGANLQLRQLWNDPSCQVILGDDPGRLADYLSALASQGRAQWTANDVAVTFRGLNILPYLPAPQDLIAEGFVGPVDTTLWHGGPQQARAEQFRDEQAREFAGGGPMRITAPWYSPWELYPKQAGGINMGRGFMRILLALGMLVAIAWVIWFVIAVVLDYVS